MKKRTAVFLALAIAGTSCTKEIRDIDTDHMETPQTLTAKLAGGSEGEIIPGSLLVKLDKETTGMIQDGRFKEVHDDILAEIGVTYFAPALPVKPKNTRVAEKYGLGQWFVIGFDEKDRVQDVAERISRAEAVELIQYRRYIEPVRAEEAFPFTETPSTKSAENNEGGFNDPYSSYQWNLYNDGTIAEDAVAGADVGVKDAWKLTGGDPSVTVAIFDCAVAYRHEDLADAVWRNEAEISGADDTDDDGNGFIDDKYGFNFVKCFAIDNDYISGKLDGTAQPAVDGNPLNSSKGIGHGTHVAGIIGAVNGNGKGISSIAGGTGNGDGVRLMSCQIFEGNDYTTDAQSAAAFIYAADNGACIAQCSYGNQFMITDDDTYINGGEVQYNGTAQKVDGSPLENAALKYFLDPENSNHESLEGNIAVFAAGNHSNPYSIYPGALPYVLSVTAYGYDWLPGGYSNYGPGCKIAAPGGEWKGTIGSNEGMILSTGLSNSVSGGYPGLETGKGESKNYVYMQGTSMACPHVSGVIALGLSYAKKLGKRFTREELTSLLLSSVNDIDQYNTGGSRAFYPPFSSQSQTIEMNRYKGNMGTGAVDAWKFLMAIEGTPTLLAATGRKMSIDISRYCDPHDRYTISVDDDSRNSLGLVSDPVIKDGKLEVECTRIGSGKIVLHGAVGKDPEKGNGIGEMSWSRTLSIASRPFAAENGGWL